MVVICKKSRDKLQEKDILKRVSDKSFYWIEGIFVKDGIKYFYCKDVAGGFNVHEKVMGRFFECVDNKFVIYVEGNINEKI